MKVPKNCRVEDKELLATYREKPCIICGTTQYVVAHHLKTRGSSGDDIPSNLVPLCIRDHHDIHKVGLSVMANRHYNLKRFLIDNGWVYFTERKKWARHAYTNWETE